MIDIEEMSPAEGHALLRKIGFGHLGCSRDGRPYVVPIHYAYEEPYIYLFTTEGMKTDYIAANPQVCVQVEDVKDSSHWQSVVVTGRAERLQKDLDREHALKIISGSNPSLSPALSRVWTDAWGRADVPAIYRIRAEIISGRKTRNA
jgi:nitroimidazol reductase NimA-like FMN-containing flavoprotein (pyridoxamine 5'-phosphate oxidase superfamily)